MKKRIEMRIVGLNKDTIIIQRKNGSIYENEGWTQTTMNFLTFKKMMQDEFSDYLKEYLGADGYEMANFFYEYGQEGQVDTFIFK